ncbi:hypothetical protein M9Y10_014944 [Tritrichomonas musculus]|uniref:Caspase family p20 domain-containing protein n=1 Tax=Tritrichomonas musculus TaxID=1915356 RepID=A0ABR2L1C9_9EUKA
MPNTEAETKKSNKDDDKKATKNKSQTKSKKSVVKKPAQKFSWVDDTENPPFPSKYVHKSVNLDKKNPEFTAHQFQITRHSQMFSTVIESFHSIAKCLNKLTPSMLPKKPVDRVLFNLINTNKNVGCFNDAYLMSLIHRKLGYKIVFLYNTDLMTFLKFLEYFLTRTICSLTLYYSGTDCVSKIRHIGHGIKFMDKTVLTSVELGQFIGQKSNRKAFILVLSDCESGNCVFDMEACKKNGYPRSSDIVNFISHKSRLTPDQKARSHGILTYYFCKLIRQFPTICPKDMCDKLNEATKRFKLSFSFDTTCDDDRLATDIMFEDADISFNGPNAEITGPSKRLRIISKPKKTVEAIPISAQEQ